MKAAIELQTSIPVEEQQLLLGSQFLDDPASKPLSDAAHNESLLLVRRYPGWDTGGYTASSERNSCALTMTVFRTGPFRFSAKLLEKSDASSSIGVTSPEDSTAGLAHLRLTTSGGSRGTRQV